MKIYIISRGYPSERYVTNGIFEFDQARALAAQGHEVVFLALDLRSLRRKRKFGFESFNKDGVQIEAINIPCGKLHGNVLRWVRAWALNKLYKKCVSQYGSPDVLHAHFQEIGYTTAKVLKKKGIPLVLTEHLSKLNNKVLEPELIQTGRETYPLFDKVIAVGADLQKSLYNNFSVTACVIPNVVDTDVFSISESVGVDKLETDEFRIVSVGSLIKRKQMHLLIEAFAEFHKECNNSYLDIFGEGPEKEQLQQQIAQYHLESYVILHGACERKVIAVQMARSDCFALASSVETFGVVYIEAMAMGLPVIATKSNGPENFVDDSNGILIDIGNKEQLVYAMKTMKDNLSQYNRKLISEKTKIRFSAQTVANQLLRIYHECQSVN